MPRVVAVILLGFATLLVWPSAATAPAGDGLPNRYTVQTDQGVFTLQLFDALYPDSAQEFRQRLEFGYYDGAVFARRPGGRLLQLGLRRGDGEAPDCRFIPESCNATCNAKTVAWALSVPDSNNAQFAGYPFFINLADNEFKGQGFPVFAEVTDGWETVLRLRPGDCIVQIRALP